MIFQWEERTNQPIIIPAVINSKLTAASGCWETKFFHSFAVIYFK
jgi:hypothetical protein